MKAPSTRFSRLLVLVVAVVAVTLLAACSEELPSSEPSGPIQWSLVAPAIDGGAVFSVWGPASTDIWAVGGERGRPLVLRYDGGSWRESAPPTASQQLWWVHGTKAGPTIVVGDGGSSFRYDGEVWSDIPGAPAGSTLYGVWMASATDGWAVGGPYDGRPAGIEAAGDVLLRYSGGQWVEQAVDALKDRPGQRRLFKVWGSAPDDVFVVGTEGLILHFDGVSWTPMESGVTAQLFTVSGRGPDDVWAVGGGASGVLLHYDGKSWSTRELPEFTPQILQGVYASPGRQEVLVSGFFGFTARLDLTTDTWEVPDTVTPHPLHAIFADSDGRLWAAGGDIAAAKSNYTGVIIASDPAVPNPDIGDATGDTTSDTADIPAGDSEADSAGDVADDQADAGPVACDTPATSCPESLPHAGAPCAGDLSCDYPVNDVLKTVHTAACNAQVWTVSTTCEPALGGGCDPPPLAESCTSPHSGTLAGASVAVGPKGAGALVPYVDGALVDLVWGGQGSPMFEFRAELEGAGTESIGCANVRTTIAIDGTPQVDAGQPVVFRCGSTLGVFVIVPASPIDCEDRLFTLDITVEVEGLGSTSVTLQVQGGQNCFG